MSELLKRITIDDKVCNGRPTIRGYRITVQTILEFLLAGTSGEEILEQYPVLESEDIEACKEFALSMMENKYSVSGTAA
ncbi:MAG: DUF433 domain-containing protein [Saprospiraceae bacterium]|nr:DUF433 domain-containing protein [Saprospiraceae bacterium]MCB9326988.1 DUF433 domain-containing protein [Lewinellaceae bacterium]